MTFLKNLNYKKSIYKSNIPTHDSDYICKKENTEMKLINLTALMLITTLLLNSTQSQAQCHIDDWTALKALYESTDGDNWIRNDGWEEVTGDIPTANCDLELLHGIILDSQGYVESIILETNQLIGNIPAELGNISNLLDLDLKGNQLNGSIPAELGNLSNLDYLNFGENQLSGSIPAELGNLSNLEYLFLGDNQLSGSIPAELGNLSNLVYLRLYNNQLSGSVPDELSKLSELTYLDLFYNQLSDSIPAELGNLSNLVNLDLSYNKFNGSIPAALGNLSKLEAVWLQNNKFSGSIPAELGNLSELSLLWLDNNQLSGSIPNQLGNLNNLKKLRLENNKLSGSIPAELSNLSNLSIDNNYFSCTDVQTNFQQLNQIDNFDYSPQYFKPTNYEKIESNVFDTLSIEQSLNIKIDFPFDTTGYTFQRFHNENILPVATQAIFNLDSIQPNNVGKYTLQATSENCLPDGNTFEAISEPMYVIFKGYDLYGQPVEYDQIMVQFDTPEETKKYENEILRNREYYGEVINSCNCNRELYLWEFPNTEAAVTALLEIDEKIKRIKSKNRPKGGFNNNLSIGESTNTPIAYNVISDSFNNNYADSVSIFILDSGLDEQNYNAVPFLYNPASVDSCFEIEQSSGYSYVDSTTTITANYSDDLWHGTFGFRSITANLEEKAKLKLVPLKIFDENGKGNLFDMTCALYHAIDHNADIVNISAGYQGQPSAILESAINLAREKGIFITAAAGNDTLNIDNTPQYPAYYAGQYHKFETIDASGNIQLDSIKYDHVISVASINAQDSLSLFSNYGKKSVTIATYGENIHSYGLEGLDVVASGSSMATFFATKALALEIAKNNKRAYQEIWSDFETNWLKDDSSLINKTQTGKQIRFDIEAAIIKGCTDPGSANYFMFANVDDGSCITSIEDIEYEINVNIYPNPSKGIVNINFSKQFGSLNKIEVFNSKGELKFSNSLFNDNKLNLNGYASGIYLIKISNTTKSKIRKLIIK